MLDGLGLHDLFSASGWTVLGALLALGWLVPKRTVDREQKLLIRESDAWKATVETQGKQLTAILEELQRPGERRPPEKGPT